MRAALSLVLRTAAAVAGTSFRTACAIWSPAFRNLTAESVKESRELGLRVIPWTVNDKAEIERLIDLGVDGLISDYPDRVRSVAAGRGLPLPPRVTPSP